MQRKPGFPVANCSIKMPDIMQGTEGLHQEQDDVEHAQLSKKLINFGHVLWGFNNWNWSVTKQELDFVDFSNGKHCAGVCAFVSVSVKTCDLRRENIGYATASAVVKGTAIHRARKYAVTNALRETLLSFGGNVASELLEALEAHRTEHLPQYNLAPPPHSPPEQPENNQNLANKSTEPKNSPLNKNIRKDSVDSTSSMRMNPVIPVIKNVVPSAPPVAKAHPMPVNLPANRPPLPANAPRPPAPPVQHPRPNSNEGRLEAMSEEEARAERKRRQQRAQEEFRLKMLHQNKHAHGTDDEPQEEQKSNIDALLLEIPTQNIAGEESGAASGDKRKSPEPSDSAAAKRRTHQR